MKHLIKYLIPATLDRNIVFRRNGCEGEYTLDHQHQIFVLDIIAMENDWDESIATHAMEHVVNSYSQYSRPIAILGHNILYGGANVVASPIMNIGLKGAQMSLTQHLSRLSIGNQPRVVQYGGVLYKVDNDAVQRIVHESDIVDIMR